MLSVVGLYLTVTAVLGVTVDVLIGDQVTAVDIKVVSVGVLLLAVLVVDVGMKVKLTVGIYLVCSINNMGPSKYIPAISSDDHKNKTV